MKRWRRLEALLAGAAALLLVGCGSGGSGGGTAGAAGNGSVGMFVADDFSSTYSQVWMTLYRVEISPDGTNYQTLYDNPSGAPMNLPALSGTAQFLGAADVPPGSYTQARITVGDHLHMITAGNGGSLDPPLVAGGGAGANGQYAFVMNLPVTVVSGQKTNMVLDFNLPNFQMIGSQVQISVQGIDPGHFTQMQKQGDLQGSVTNLQPGSGFNLTLGGGMMGSMMPALQVRLSSTTTIFDAAAGKPATLANGQRVEVQGAIDPTTYLFTATMITIQDGGSSAQNMVNVQGTITAIDTSAKSFALAPAWTANFQPVRATLTVQTDTNTVFAGGMMMGGGGSFSNLSAGSAVMVSGAYNAASNVLTASRIMPH